MSETIYHRYRLKRRTTAGWAANNEVLGEGEPGIEVLVDGTEKIKYGDGVKAWAQLSYQMPTAAQVGADASGTAAAAVAAHAAAADPHPDYVLESDLRLSNPRTPTAHKSTHATGGTDALSPADIGAATTAQGAKADTAIQPGNAALSDAREWNADTISQAEAEAGTATTRRAFTAARIFQAVAAWWAGSAAKTKLDGIANNATANATDAELRNRSTHTGTQPWSTITGTPTTLGGYGITDSFNPATPGAIGGTTPGAGSFSALLATTRLGLPSGAPASPVARDLYQVADTLRYRDSGGAERLLLNANDNLANLSNTSTARTNLSAVGTVTTGITGAAQITNIVSISQANYDAITTKNSQTLYIISG